MARVMPKDLESDLLALQRRIVNEDAKVLLIVEGSSGTVIGRSINELMNVLEPRVTGYTHFVPATSIDSPNDIGRYIDREPASGTISIYDRSWYSAMMLAHTRDRPTEGYVSDCLALEAYLSYNGVIVIKMFLDVEEDDIDKRTKEYGEKRIKDKTFLTDDHIGAKAFDRKFFKKIVDRTGTFHSPWDVIRVKGVDDTVSEMARILVSRTEAGLGRTLPDHGFRVEPLYDNPRENADLTLEADGYGKELEKISSELYKLQNKLAASGRSLILVFEGWDAAGKGSTIRRVARALNPRGYYAVGTAAPVGAERLHTHLWRFTRKLPEKGHIAIFDRSWYGRMMVEPIEGLCTEEEYNRSASEIRFFERGVAEAGGIIIKFWLEISPEEQLERFRAREEDPLKQWKITDEDWRNREKWDVYEEYVDRMISSTNIPEAPWVVVESEDKRYGRLKVLRTIIDTLEKELH